MTRPQPASGDTVMVCQHIAEAVTQWHFYALPNAPLLISPSGVKVRPSFVVLCTPCHQRAAGKPLDLPLAPKLWKGDDPLPWKDGS